MARRMFFVPAVRRGEAELTAEAAQHLVRVLRVEEGEQYEISDNAHRYLATIGEARKSRVVFRVDEQLPDAPAAPAVTLLASLFKFDHFEWLLEKATELNVARVVPIVSARSENGLDKAARKRSERWERILLEASQQARRAVRPELSETAPFHEALSTPATHRVLLDERREGPPLGVLRVNTPDSVALLLGPEGGWTDGERESAAAGGWIPMSLGRNILRAETAGVSALAIIAQAFLLAEDSL